MYDMIVDAGPSEAGERGEETPAGLMIALDDEGVEGCNSYLSSTLMSVLTEREEGCSMKKGRDMRSARDKNHCQ